MRRTLAERFAPQPDRTSGKSLFDRLGGRQCLERVHKRLYDRIYAHPVLSAFFAGKGQTHQENQQTDFLSEKFGGPNLYCGRVPQDAHPHLFITDELFELRHRILSETLDECGVEPELRDKWLAIDRSFKRHLVKKTLGECSKRYVTDRIIVAPGTE